MVFLLPFINILLLMSKIKYRLLLVLYIFLCSQTYNAKGQKSMPNKDLWPRGVNYQIFVRSFCDSNHDGIGDLNGITSKLDYLKSLGINGLWITPINVSPSYHKYDIVNYMAIDPECGTLEDMKHLTAEIHKRGMHILMDLVVNHTSTKHPWFLDAKFNVNSPYRNYYIWSAPQNIKEEPNWWPISKENSDESAERYFGHFGSNMPDLNYDNPKVRAEIIAIGNYWMKEVGIDGFRLDAAQHIYKNSEHDKSIKWWQEFRHAMEKIKPDFFMVGEVWNADSIVAPYLKESLNSAFNFDLASTIIQVVQNEQNDNLVLKHQRIMALYKRMQPKYVDATFLRNHDQTRVASILKGNQDKIKLAASILLTLPGAPYIYYGEELGMQGEKPDEYMREPFLWDVKKNDACRTTWMKPIYNTGEKTVPLAMQMEDPYSIFTHYKKLIALRNKNTILQTGTLAPLVFKKQGLVGYMRSLNGKTIYVIHNLTKNAIVIDFSSFNIKKPGVIFDNSFDQVVSANLNNKSISGFSTLIFK
jgi:alpha-amylase